MNINEVICGIARETDHPLAERSVNLGQSSNDVSDRPASRRGGKG